MIDHERDGSRLDSGRAPDTVPPRNDARDRAHGGNGAPASGDGVDGRTLRRTRNRDAVIDAMLAMIREGDLQPTAASIADRAGVSHRSIFRYFDDLDDLVQATIGRAFEEARPLREIPNLGQGSIEERIDAFVDARIALYTHIDATMQVARHKALVAPPIERGMKVLYDFGRAQIRQHFAAEVARHEPVVQDALVDAALTVAGYDAYALHQRVLQNTPEQLRTTMRTALRLLLGAPAR